MWFSQEMRALSDKAQVIALYLITNSNIGLTRIYHQPDLELIFLFNLTPEELKSYKKELESVKLFFFQEEWVYINNDFSYCDYEGRDRVMKSRDAELKGVPNHILRGFKGVNKGLARGYKPPINNKPLNNKRGGMGGTQKIEDEEMEKATEILNFYNKIYGRNITSVKSFIGNFHHWIRIHSVDEMKRAIMHARTWTRFGGDFDLATFFRTKNKLGECDYFDDFINKGFYIPPDLTPGDKDYLISELQLEDYWNPDSKDYKRFRSEQLPFVEEAKAELLKEYGDYPSDKKEVYRGLLINDFI